MRPAPRIENVGYSAVNKMSSVHSLKKVQKLRDELEVLLPLKPDIENKVLQKIRLDWNFNSISGDRNSLSLDETRALITLGSAKGNKPLKDYLEMKIHNDTISWMFEIASLGFVLTEDFIKQIHESILLEPYEVQSFTKRGKPVLKMVELGKYKQTPNFTYGQNGKILDFATPEETPALMKDLIDWFAAEVHRSDLEPVSFATEFHYKFVKIQPFDDANGRIAKILTNLILMQFGLPPIVILKTDRNLYQFALQEADKGKLETLLDFVARKVIGSLEFYLKAAHGESLEEIDSLEKELITLEKRLRKLGSKIVKREKIVLLDIYDRSILPLLNRLIEVYGRFDRFYIDKKLEITITSLTNLGVNGVGEKKSFVAKSLSHLRELLLNEPLDLNPEILVNYAYSSFNREGFADVEYRNQVIVHFDELEYRIIERSAPGVNSTYLKKYSEEVDPEEVEAIIAKTVEAQKAFIENKIERLEGDAVAKKA